MADTAPLLFRKAFGALRPANKAAEEAMAAIDGDKPVRVRITRASGNTRRMAIYWVYLGIAVENLSDRIDGGVLSTQALHRKLKRDLGLAKPIVSPRTGEIIDYDYESIAFEAMPENERAEFITAAIDKLSRWLGCDPADLKREAEAQAA